MCARPAQLRKWHRRAVVEGLLRTPAASRAELARRLRLSKPTVGQVVGQLQRSGWLELAAVQPEPALNATATGRPGAAVQLSRQMGQLLLMEIGVRTTRLLAAALNPRETCVELRSFATGTQPARWQRLMVEKLRALRPHMGRALLVSLPGIVDQPAGRSLFCPNLHWLEGLPLAADLRRALGGTPVWLQQEIQALARGEALATGTSDFLLVDLDDGLGAAAMIHGQLFTSATPLVGELGHTPVQGVSERCGCGGVGCLETLVSRSALLRGAGMHTPTAPRSWEELRDQLASTKRVPAWLKPRLIHLAHGIAGALNCFGLERVVLTGLLPELGLAAQTMLTNHLTTAAMRSRFGAVSCVYAPRRRELGLIAAGIDHLLPPAPPVPPVPPDLVGNRASAGNAISPHPVAENQL